MNKLAYICSPYRGNIFQVMRNKRYARKLTKSAIEMGFAPITTHLYMTQVLDDKQQEERTQGLKAGKEILDLCSTIIIGTKYGISSGMVSEISAAKGHNVIFIL